MSNYSRKVLVIDLTEKKASLSSFADLGHLLGGLGIGLELLHQFKESGPTVFSIGPLNGFFPFASKVCALSFLPDKILESYLSGRSSLIMRFAGTDALVITGTASAPLYVSIYPGGVVDFIEGESGQEQFAKSGIMGRRSLLTFASQGSLSDNFFNINDEIGRRLYLNNLHGIAISGDTSLPLVKENEYKELYLEILSKGSQLDVPYGGRLSCGGCPAGCDFSEYEEQKPELVLSHCLVTCGFAGKAYENIPLIFSCLNSLGLPYRHEDLEALPDRIKYIRQHL